MNWCGWHRVFEDEHLFQPRRENGKLRGVVSQCRRSWSERSFADRELPTCRCCGVQKSFKHFAGNSLELEVRACRDCHTANPGKRWCGYCARWLDSSDFYNSAVMKCRICKMAAAHGSSYEQIMEVNGAVGPLTCAVCGRTDGKICIDHDHSCCPGTYSCGACIRGILCSFCNLLEGLMQTPDRADKLAAYMRRTTRVA